MVAQKAGRHRLEGILDRVHDLGHGHRDDTVLLSELVEVDAGSYTRNVGAVHLEKVQHLGQQEVAGVEITCAERQECQVNVRE